MARKLIKRELILAKIESAYGVDATPGAGDAILVENVQPNPAEAARMNERPAVRRSLAPLQQVYGGSLFSLGFDVEIKGSGTAGVAPELGVLLRACAMDETIVADTSVAYSPISDHTAQESLTLYYYEDGSLTKILGCIGTVTGNAEVGGIAKLSFVFRGHIGSEADAALISPTYDETVPAPFIDGAFSIGSYAAVVAGIAFDLGNQVEPPPDLNSADGFAALIVTGRDVTGSFAPEAPLKADHDFIARFRAGTTEALTTGVIGATAGNRYEISMPSVHYRGVAAGDRNSIRTYEMSFGASEVTLDDEFILTFT